MPYLNENVDQLRRDTEICDRCAARECGAPPSGPVEVILGERWFVCARGHLNAAGLTDLAEAA